MQHAVFSDTARCIFSCLFGSAGNARREQFFHGDRRKKCAVREQGMEKKANFVMP